MKADEHSYPQELSTEPPQPLLGQRAVEDITFNKGDSTRSAHHVPVYAATVG